MTIDLITQLPSSQAGFDATVVAVDHLSQPIQRLRNCRFQALDKVNNDITLKQGCNQAFKFKASSMLCASTQATATDKLRRKLQLQHLRLCSFKLPEFRGEEQEEVVTEEDKLEGVLRLTEGPATLLTRTMSLTIGLSVVFARSAEFRVTLQDVPQWNLAAASGKLSGPPRQ